MRFGRRAAAGVAVWLGLLTAAITATSGATAWSTVGGLAYVALVVAAQSFPGALMAQVVGGQVLVGSLLLDPRGPPALLLLPVVALVVATAELSAAAQRSRVPWRRDRGEDVRRTAIHALVGAGTFGLVAVIAQLPGPSGLVAITLAVGACVVVAAVLARGARIQQGARAPEHGAGSRP